MSNVTHVSQDDDQERNNATSDTTFGRSVESQAQIKAAKLIASATDPGEVLNVYRLMTAAPIDDPIWQGQLPIPEVTVAARTAGDARIVAAGLELDTTDIARAPADDVTTTNASVFRNELAYTVIEIERGRSGLKRGAYKADQLMAR
jgi:hypothetical protein